METSLFVGHLDALVGHFEGFVGNLSVCWTLSGFCWTPSGFRWTLDLVAWTLPAFYKTAVQQTTTNNPYNCIKTQRRLDIEVNN